MAYYEEQAYRRLRLFHWLITGSLIVSFAANALTALCLSQVNYSHSLLHCVVKARWTLDSITTSQVLKQRNVTKNGTIRITGNEELDISHPVVFSRSDDSRLPSCYLLHFGSVGAAIAAMLFAWLLCLFRPRMKHLRNREELWSSRIMLSLLLLSLACLGLSVSAAVDLSIQISRFCAHLLGQKEHISWCGEINKFSLYVSGEDLGLRLGDRNFYQLLISAQIFAWLAVLAWLSATLLSLLRVLGHLDYPNFYWERPLPEHSMTRLMSLPPVPRAPMAEEE